MYVLLPLLNMEHVSLQAVAGELGVMLPSLGCSWCDSISGRNLWQHLETAGRHCHKVATARLHNNSLMLPDSTAALTEQLWNSGGLPSNQLHFSPMLGSLLVCCDCLGHHVLLSHRSRWLRDGFPPLPCREHSRLAGP